MANVTSKPNGDKTAVRILKEPQGAQFPDCDQYVVVVNTHNHGKSAEINVNRIDRNGTSEIVDLAVVGTAVLKIDTPLGKKPSSTFPAMDAPGILQQINAALGNNDFDPREAEAIAQLAFPKNFPPKPRTP